MDDVLNGLFSLQTLIFIVIIYLAVATFRRIIEKGVAPNIAKFFPDKWEPWWIDLWREWVLLAMPAVIGGLIAFFVKSYPYPEIFAESISGRVFFGIVAGLICNNTYKFLKKKINQLMPVSVQEKMKSIIPNAITSIRPPKPEEPEDSDKE